MIRSACLVTPALDDNALGRTFSIWSLLTQLGIDADIVSVAPAKEIWFPLRDTEFARRCEQLDLLVPQHESQLREMISSSDVLIITKAVPTSLGLVVPYLDSAKQILIDIDDPDIEVQMQWREPLRRLNAMRHPDYWMYKRLRSMARSHSRIVSNPTLKRLYGGTVVPHARADPGFGAPHTAIGPVVAFIGTPRWHKGFDVLRDAVAEASDHGFRLRVSAPAPPDAKPWEEWVGRTSLQEGLALVQQSDIIAIPSLNKGFGRAQLPVKLMDAMLAGRAVIASDVEPMRWALGDSGIITKPGSRASLFNALMELRDPALRSQLGFGARARALSSFTVDAVAPTLAEVLNSLPAGSTSD